jgi:putative transposase
MKQILYTYKFKLNATEEQKILLNKHFGSVRWSYNYFLNQRMKEYIENKKSITYEAQSAKLTELKKENIWLNEINSQTLQYSLKCLDQAYQGFFNKRTQFPKFKSKKSKNSFTAPQKVYIENDKLSIIKFREGIKFIKDREIQGLIKKCTISKTPTNKYFVSILVEKEIEQKQKTNKEIAIDLGLKDFLVLSDGSKVKNHRFLKHYERQLKLNQKHLSRKTKGSKRRERQRLKVARIYEKISNCRIDLLQKVSTDLIEKFDVIYVEDLNIKGMSTRCKPKQDENGKYLWTVSKIWFK